MKSWLAVLFLGVVVVLLQACTTPLVSSRDLALEPISQTFNAPAIAAFEAAEQALRDMDFKVEYADQDQGILRTGWMPTTADSHYLELFGREDYGTTGAYYHLTVRITAEGPGSSVVKVSAPLRTIVTRMNSSYRQEKKFLAKVKDLLRPADIQVTNIGVIEHEPVPIRP